jgi:hypothetical protein
VKLHGDLWWRIRLLVTRKSRWTDEANNSVVVFTEPLAVAWALAGWHSYNWWWVRKFGTKGCGCVFNPITRLHVIFCSPHAFSKIGVPADWLDGDDEDDGST